MYFSNVAPSSASALGSARCAGGQFFGTDFNLENSVGAHSQNPSLRGRISTNVIPNKSHPFLDYALVKKPYQLHIQLIHVYQPCRGGNMWMFLISLRCCFHRRFIIWIAPNTSYSKFTWCWLSAIIQKGVRPEKDAGLTPLWAARILPQQ